MESKDSLVKRIQKISRIYKKKNRSKTFAGICVFVLFVSSLSITYAASVSTGEFYRKCYNNTVIEEMEPGGLISPEKEYETSRVDIFSDVSDIKELIIDDKSGIGALNNTLQPKECYLSAPVYIEGDRVAISAFIDGNAELQVGIIHTDGIETYSVIRQEGLIDFFIEKPGDYRIFICNTGTKEVYVQSTVLVSLNENLK